MRVSEQVIKDIVKRLLQWQDYRIEVVALINAEFLSFAIDFFKNIAQAKLDNKEVDVDWYKNTFMNGALTKAEIAVNSGLNMKTIKNMYNTERRSVVIDASDEHYHVLSNAITDLIEGEKDLDLTLTIKLRGVSIDLTINESLLVINTLAVKRAALRGGLWSSAGKRVEKPLMLTLCKLFQVPEENYAVTLKGTQTEVEESTFEREIDFYLVGMGNEFHKCEVKLMGAGNPESADAVIARASEVFVADKLSDMNKKQLDSLNVCWVELRAENGFHQFEKVLDTLKIPHGKMIEPSEEEIQKIFTEIFSTD